MAVDFNKIPSPCFVLDEYLLEKNLQLLNKVQDEAGVDIICALKGYAMWSTFPLINKYLKGGAASSLNEARLIYEKMQLKAHTYCPAFLESEFDEILKYSSHITFNSLNQYFLYIDKVKKASPGISAGLRINPEYSEVKTDLYNPAMPGSRLGITFGQLPGMLPENVDGLHFHVLCENDSHVLERTLAKVEEKFSGYIKQVEWINFGGGHLITKEGYDTNHLVTLIHEFKRRYPNIKKIILEPGGAIGWRTGYLVSTVVDVIENKGIKVAMLDVSFAAHMPDCLEMPYKPQIIGATDPDKNKPTYRLGGTTCLAGDFMGMGDFSFDNELKPGNKVIFEDMIHYTMVKTNFFNGVKHPSIGIWTKSNKFKLIRKFGYEDFCYKLS